MKVLGRFTVLSFLVAAMPAFAENPPPKPEPGVMRFAGRAPEMEPFQTLVGAWLVTQRFYRPKRGIWEQGPGFDMTFTARYEGMFIDSEQVIPFTDTQSWRNTFVISYDKFRRVYRLAMMDGIVGLMDIFEGERVGDQIVLDDVRTNTPGPNLRGDLEYVQMTLSFPVPDQFLIAVRARREGRWVEMLRYELARKK
ncbi:MAG: hypothetical protein KBA31_04210 [Alphaproteobacteria bacterium]|nr:hypothetical protein [Alphaproteobacteria bacterium]